MADLAALELSLAQPVIQRRFGDGQMPGESRQGPFVISPLGPIDIGGALAAREQGHLAALAIAAQLQHLSASNRDRLARPHFRALARCLAARPLLDTMYRPHQENRIPQDDVIVCRCEEVTAGQVRAHVRLGCLGPNQTKAFGRCGMGPCQGRLCGLTVTEIIADQRQVPGLCKECSG